MKNQSPWTPTLQKTLVLDPCTDYEARAEAKQEVIMTAWWVKCVGAGVFDQTSGITNFKLDANASSKFMSAMKIAIGNDFYERVTMHLKVILN